MSVRLLESHVVDQIAAGEVVERPASVVKELVENALDAGSTAIDVILRDGGRGLVRVADDGSGMDRDDALMCIERHATSKIRTFEDLTRARTLGFRGEALPSIAAVSRFELLTRTRDTDEGTRIRVDGGTLVDVRPAGAAPGTVVDCKALFHALPARRAFLRSAPTELSHCVETLTRLALTRTDVAFTLRHEDRELIRAERTPDPALRAGDLLGDDGRKLVPVQVGEDPDDPDTEDAARQGSWGRPARFALRGLVAPPGVHRGSAAGSLYLYVNGRWVRDQVVRRAVAQAYRGRVPEGRYPLVVLELRVPPGSVDVNVHPTKAEVRFRDPAGVAAFVEEALRSALPAPSRAHGHGPLSASASAAGAPALPFRSSVPAMPPDAAGPDPTVLPPPAGSAAAGDGPAASPDAGWSPLGSGQTDPPGWASAGAAGPTGSGSSGSVPSGSAGASGWFGAPGSSSPGATGAVGSGPSGAAGPPGGGPSGSAGPSGLAGPPGPSGAARWEWSGGSTPAAPGAAVAPRPPAPVAAEPPLAAQGPRILALVRGRYWVVEDSDGIGVIDAGRLSRRVRVRQDSGEPRRLLVPARVPVPAVIAARVEERADELASLGLVASRFSPGEVVVRAVPDAAREVDPAEVLRVALGGDDVREAWAERLPVAEVPDDLEARATALGLPLGPLVGRVQL